MSIMDKDIISIDIMSIMDKDIIIMSIMNKGIMGIMNKGIIMDMGIIMGIIMATRDAALLSPLHKTHPL
jgi:hypothetical protein